MTDHREIAAPPRCFKYRCDRPVSHREQDDRGMYWTCELHADDDPDDQPGRSENAARRAEPVTRRPPCDWCGEPGEWLNADGIYCTDCYEQFVGPAPGGAQ